MRRPRRADPLPPNKPAFLTGTHCLSKNRQARPCPTRLNTHLFSCSHPLARNAGQHRQTNNLLSTAVNAGIVLGRFGTRPPENTSDRNTVQFDCGGSGVPVNDSRTARC